jgi:hypothetical protein
MGYDHFEAAVYVTTGDINRIRDMAQFEAEFAIFERYVNIGKVYLETYRSDEYSNRDRLIQLKSIFQKKGIKTAGGVTTTKKSGDQRWGLLCFSQDEDKERLRQVSRITAALFDEFILDDFYFTNCKCDSCLAAKGEQSWPEFRIKLLAETAREYIIKPAKEINPDVKVIIKYPNWYEHYQNNGYNIEDETRIFDAIYTGTETRDPVYTQQHLQSYLSYFLMRYLENVGPGKNNGGWFDSFDCYNPVNFMEQANLTLFAKAREVTLFCFGLLKYMYHLPLAGYAFEWADGFLGDLGNPIGVACYKPYHSSGEDYLYDYLGMLGIPLEPFPEFPTQSPLVLLTASAAKDGEIVNRMKNHLRQGKSIVITSGLLKKLTGKGIEDLGVYRCSDQQIRIRRLAYQPHYCAFIDYYETEGVLPNLEYSTNDSWPLIVGISDEYNVPLLLSNSYSRGKFFVWNIPDDYHSLYQFPKEILKAIREILTPELPVLLDAKAKIGLFVYDNGTFIVHSFLPHPTEIRLLVQSPMGKLGDLMESREIEAAYYCDGKAVFPVILQPGNYKVYKIL